MLNFSRSVVNVKSIRVYFGMQIDAVAKSRDGRFRMASNDEREQTLNQLLTVSIPLTLLISFKCKKILRKKILLSI